EPEEVFTRLATLDLIAVPSVWYENRPQVILEAFQAGVPVVASRIGGLPELVADEVSGLLHRPGDAADLARQLRRILEERSLLPPLRSGVPGSPTFEQEMQNLLRIYDGISSRRSA